MLPSVVAALGKDVASHAAILDFLRVLPEEVTEGRKINLTVRGYAHQTSTHTNPHTTHIRERAHERKRAMPPLSEPPMT